jgi:hypothetical protein
MLANISWLTFRIRIKSSTAAGARNSPAARKRTLGPPQFSSMNSTPASAECRAAISQAHDFSQRIWVRFARFLVFVFEPQVASLHEAWERRADALPS